jgi:hypothetical protein
MGYGTALPDDPARPNLPKIWQPKDSKPSTINKRMIADFTHLVEATRIGTTASSTEEYEIDHR